MADSRACAAARGRVGDASQHGCALLLRRTRSRPTIEEYLADIVDEDGEDGEDEGGLWV